jgi:hypothetical protein
VSNVAIKPRPTAVVLRGDFAKTNVEVDPSRVVIRVRQQPVLVRPVSPTTIVRMPTQGPQGVSAQIITKLYAVVTTQIPANTDASGPSHDGNLDADLGDLSAENFLTDYDVFISGAIKRPGADVFDVGDYYPGTSLANGQLRFRFPLRAGGNPDVITLIKRQ